MQSKGFWQIMSMFWNTLETALKYSILMDIQWKTFGCNIVNNCRQLSTLLSSIVAYKNFSIIFFKTLFLYICFFFIIIPIDHDENWLIDIKKLSLAKIKRKISIKSKRSHVKIDLVMKKAICTKIKFWKRRQLSTILQPKVFHWTCKE